MIFLFFSFNKNCYNKISSKNFKIFSKYFLFYVYANFFELGSSKNIMFVASLTILNILIFF